MLDRASTFADPRILELLEKRLVPVAIDQAYQRRQKDAEGDLYRKIASQGPRSDFSDTTQGLYVATAGGQLLGYTNNRGADRVLRMIQKALDDYRPEKLDPLEKGKPDPRYNPEPPGGGLVVRVRARVLGGYPPTENRWKRIFQSATSRDNLWISRREHEALVAGELPAELVRRLARFHLVDNTRGEPPMWRRGELRSHDLELRDGRIEGRIHLETPDGKRRFLASVRIEIETEGKRVTRLDGVIRGLFRGEGRYTRGAPPGDFPLAITLELADGQDVADPVPPQGSRGWVEGYLKS